AEGVQSKYRVLDHARESLHRAECRPRASSFVSEEHAGDLHYSRGDSASSPHGSTQLMTPLGIGLIPARFLAHAASRTARETRSWRPRPFAAALRPPAKAATALGAGAATRLGAGG